MTIEILNKLPMKAQSMYEKVYTIAKSKHGSDRASQIAWTAVKDKFKKVEDSWVARSEDFEVFTTVHYEFVADEATLSRSEDSEFSFVDYVLLSNDYHTDGIKFGPMAYNSLIDQINNEGLVGRIDDDKHEVWKSLTKQGKSPEEIEEYLQNMNTGIRAISAKNIDGKVTARIQVRNDLVDKVMNYKGASVEARFPSESFRNKIVTQARYQGFVFTPTPADPKALRVGLNG